MCFLYPTLLAIRGNRTGGENVERRSRVEEDATHQGSVEAWVRGRVRCLLYVLCDPSPLEESQGGGKGRD